MSEFYVVVRELDTGNEVRRMGPITGERSAERTLMGVLRNMDLERYTADTEPAPEPPK